MAQHKRCSRKNTPLNPEDANHNGIPGKISLYPIESQKRKNKNLSLTREILRVTCSEPEKVFVKLSITPSNCGKPEEKIAPYP